MINKKIGQWLQWEKQQSIIEKSINSNYDNYEKWLSCKFSRELSSESSSRFPLDIFLSFADVDKIRLSLSILILILRFDVWSVDVGGTELLRW